MENIANKEAKSEVESDEQTDKLGERGGGGRRDGREKGEQFRDERALHILLYQSKQPAHQPRVSLSASVSLLPSHPLFFTVLLSLPDTWQHVERGIKKKRCREMEGKQILGQHACVNVWRWSLCSCVRLHACVCILDELLGTIHGRKCVDTQAFHPYVIPKLGAHTLLGRLWYLAAGISSH